MNNCKVFFYNHHRIWYLDLDNPESNLTFKDTGISIDLGVKNIFIRKVIAGRSDDQISILLGFTDKRSQLI
jgi:hypothetical protein